MKTPILLTGAALLVLAGCSRGGSEENGPLGVRTNTQTGVITTPQGLRLDPQNAAGGCLSSSDMQRPPSDFSPEQRRQIVGCINTGLARQINAQLPRQIDPVTRLDRLTTAGSLLTYHYTVLRPASSLPPGSLAQIQTQTRSMACAQPSMRQTIELGGAYGYRWVDNQGALIGELRIDAC